MLKIKNLHVEVEDKKILNGINLEIPNGEIHVIMGPNGIGKSTLCKIIMGDKNYKVTKGEVAYNNLNLLTLNTHEIAQQGVFLLMQNPTSIPGVTNAEMLRAALLEKGIQESIFEFNKRVNKACENLSIDKSYIHRNINEFMSGGEKKKNEMLQIEILKPSFIMLDELDSGLDIDSLKDISKRLDKYCKENNASLLIITHHINMLEYLHPDKVHLLNNGKIVHSGDESLAKLIEEKGFKGAFSIGE